MNSNNHNMLPLSTTSMKSWKRAFCSGLIGDEIVGEAMLCDNIFCAQRQSWPTSTERWVNDMVRFLCRYAIIT
jgi:hypothetical protein